MSLKLPPPRRGGSKLSREQVKRIAKLASRGLAHQKIGEMYGISSAMVGHIASGRRWAGVSGIPPQTRVPRLTPSQRRDILQLRKHGISGEKIAEVVECSKATVWRVIAQSRSVSE